MSTDNTSSNYEKSALEFKSTSLNVPVLVIFSSELHQVELALNEKIAKAPDFFKNSPLLIDLQYCNTSENAINAAELIDYLHQNKLLPIGVSGGNDEQNKQSLSLNISTRAIRSTNTASAQTISTDIVKKDDDQAPVTEANTAPVENMLVSHPVRSGQRVYAKGDLTILSHVSAGAEIMAEGSIHIYGALRGRALAGVQGDIESRIYCSDLQAELVSIAGQYKTSEDMNTEQFQHPVQILLKEQSLIIKKL